MAKPVPSTVRIIDGYQGKEGTPMVKSRAFQLTTNVSLIAQDVVKGM